MLHYALYARKSHDDRKITRKSLGEQVAECRQLALKDQLQIDWKGEESKSAMKPNQRPYYSRMIELIRKGSIDAILCWHVNRLIRNMEEGGALVQLMVDGKLKEIRTPHAVYRTGESIWQIVIEAASATQSSIDHRWTVERSLEGNFRAGGWNHKALPGYRNVRDALNSKKGAVEADPNQFFLARKAWDLILTETVTIQEAQRRLEAWGYRVRPTLNFPERPLSYQTLWNMLRNPFYAGFVREKGELVKGKHVPMVTIDEFERVQRIIRQRSFSAKRRHFHAYAGVMRCGYCRQGVTAEWKKLRSGAMWETYHCSDTYERCTQKGIAASEVERQLSARLDEFCVDCDALDIAVSQVRQGVESQQSVFDLRRKEQQKAVDAVENELSRLTDMWISGLITDPERFRKAEKRLLEKQRHAVLAVEGSNGMFAAMLGNLDRAAEFLRSGRMRFARALPCDKRPIIAALGSFQFFGREKEIKVDARPLLRQLVAFVKEVERLLEPLKTGSHKQNRAAFAKQLCFGGRNQTQLEPPVTLLEALQNDRMPYDESKEIFPPSG